MKPTLFLSDMHLDPSRPQIIQLFIRYLLEHGSQAREVYLLGDIFEAWIGDDAVPADHPVLGAIRRLSDSGVPVFVMRGNRDFLLGEAFAEATGTTLLHDPTVIELDGEKVLLMHGDLLCTDDVEYQQFRAMVNDPQWQAGFLAKSIEERMTMAKQARSESTNRNSELAAGREQIMDVNQQTVVDTMREHGVRRLIHGHTHRPDIHHFELDSEPASRIVLGDWFDQGSVLEVIDGRYDLQTLTE